MDYFTLLENIIRDHDNQDFTGDYQMAKHHEKEKKVEKVEKELKAHEKKDMKKEKEMKHKMKKDCK